MTRTISVEHGAASVPLNRRTQHTLSPTTCKMYYVHIVCIRAIQLRGNDRIDGADGNDRGGQAKRLVGIFSV